MNSDCPHRPCAGVNLEVEPRSVISAPVRFTWDGAHGGTHGSRSILRSRTRANPRRSWGVDGSKENAPHTPEARASSEAIPCARRPHGTGESGRVNAQPALAVRCVRAMMAAAHSPRLR